MFRNYLKVAFRYLGNHKGYALINVLGLSVGVACCILIMLFVKSEWSFDRFHSKSNKIYRAWLEEHYEGQIFTNTVTPLPLVPVLQANLPEVSSACRVAAFNTLVKYNNNTFNDPVNMVDSSFFNLFDFPLTEGDIKNPFPTNNSLIITERSAKKYFGNGPAIGKNLEMQLGNDTVLFTVSGVAKNIPLESSIQFDMLVPFSNAHHIWSERALTQAWSNVQVESYFLLKKEAAPNTANIKIASIMNPLVAKNYKPDEYLVRLQPLMDIHLNNKLPAGNQPVSDPKYSYILATVGILILLIACINFVTLSMGRSTTRALEVGVRKVLGAERLQLIRQFWGEALLLAVMALVIGIGLAIVLQKPFDLLANRQLSLTLNGFTVLFCFLLAAIIALLAGMYPAFVLSNFKPIQVLKGRLKAEGMGFFRKALIAGQFVASIIMMIGTFTVTKQLNYLRTKDLGFNKEHIIVVPTNKSRREGNRLAIRFREALQKNPDIINSTTSLFSMSEYGWMNLGYMDNKNAFRQFRFNAVDADFVNTMGLHVIAGRNFSKENTADSNYILVNEALVKEYGWKNPIGQRLPGKYEEQVVGVVKDFHFETLHTTIKPAVMALKPDSLFRRSTDMSFNFPPQPRVSVLFRSGNLKNHIESLKSAWRSVAGDQDFEYQFLDETLNTAYQQEQRLSKIVRYASFLSIFIACMGLFGLATLVVVRRTKEIGIRKVLGADVGGIVVLLSKDFIVLVIIASLIAFPVAWWGLQKWLQDFAYRINIPWLAFLGAALLALVVALLTVSIQAIKAALTNPVKSLRTE
ncbi:MAG TPA: ABC transporter permease [Chitinophagaceae bacterium]|jgi:putative ABC transport system permease protein|nr:ABC transporter permease [Chitinophagaceae bacterium]